MKKALAILLALSMVFAAFADEPATNYSVAEFSGSASLEWISDLEAKTNGFANASEANLKINLLNGGDKATSGDGVWGELKIEIETPDALENPGALTIGKTAEVKTAKIHFVDGDVGIALNILKPGLGLGEVVLPTAVAADVKSAKFDVASFAPNAGEVAIKAAQAEVDKQQALYDAAKLVEAQGGAKADDTALKAAKKDLEVAKNESAALKAGFALEITSSVIDANFKVMDNGVAADKEWGFGADATIKAVENLNLKAGFAYAYEKTAFVASVDYKLGINDSLYLKPAVSFGTMDETKQLAASALFGWGTEGQEPNFIKDGGKKDDNDTRFIENKCADGFSVTFTTDMADPAVNSISFGLYDSTLLEGLKVGAAYGAKLDDFGKGTLSLAAKYGTDIDILTIALDFGFRTTFGTEKSSLYAYAVEVSTDDVIDNTKLYAKYESLTAKGADTAKGKITVGAKIAL